jgi:hypothetical protein
MAIAAAWGVQSSSRTYFARAQFALVFFIACGVCGLFFVTRTCGCPVSHELWSFELYSTSELQSIRHQPRGGNRRARSAPSSQSRFTVS